jgi:hypothetical protein
MLNCAEGAENRKFIYGAIERMRGCKMAEKKAANMGLARGGGGAVE